MELMEALQAFGVLVIESWEVHRLVQDNDPNMVPACLAAYFANLNRQCTKHTGLYNITFHRTNF